MAQSSPAVSPQDLAAGYAALAAAYAQAAAEEEAEGEVPNRWRWKVMVIWDDGLFLVKAKIWHKIKHGKKCSLNGTIGGWLFSIFSHRLQQVSVIDMEMLGPQGGRSSLPL